VLFGGHFYNGLYVNAAGATLTGGLTVHGRTGQLSTQGLAGASYAIRGPQQGTPGTVNADTAGGTITLNNTWRSSGALQAQAGTLSLNGTWSETGQVTVTSGTLNLGGSITALASGNSWTRSGGTVNLTGTLTNTSSTLTLNGNTGSWNFSGRIDGGTVAESPGAVLVVGSGPQLTGGVTVNGDLDLMTNSAFVYVSGGLTLNGTA